MRAVRFDCYGSVDVLEVRQVPDPVPATGEVVVEVRAAGINPGEAKIREGALHERWPAAFPEGEGSDFAGVVIELGPGAIGVAVGDEVVGFTNSRGSHAERVCVPAEQLSPKPAGLAWEPAGALFVAGTSGRALVDAVDVSAGDTVVVSAAAGGAGSFATQIALNAGARVVGLASPQHHDWLRMVGAIPVDYHGDGLADRIRSAAGQVNALIDTYGPGYVRLGIELGVAADRIGSIADFSAGELGARVVSHSVAATAEVLAQLAADVAAGRIEVPIAATFPLERVREAYTLLAEGHTAGKIVLVP